MQRREIFEIIKSNVIKVLPDIHPDLITIDKKLKELGANSVDRVEVVQYTMEDLNLIIPRIELGKANNLYDLTEIFYNHLNR